MSGLSYLDQLSSFLVQYTINLLALASGSKPYSKRGKKKSHCLKVYTSGINSASFPWRPRDSGYWTFPRCEGENRGHCHMSLKNFELFSPYCAFRPDAICPASFLPLTKSRTRFFHCCNAHRSRKTRVKV